MHGPRVSPPPAIDDALRLGLAHVYAIRPAHGAERADAARKAKGEDGDLADLALVVRHGVPSGVVDTRRFTLVDVAASTKHIQHGLGKRVGGEPRRRACFYRCPVGHDENVTSGGDESWAEH